MQPTAILRKAIPHILENVSVTGVARTGSGKTLAYLVPIVQKALMEKQKSVILVPTRELSTQVGKMLSKITRNCKVKWCVIHGGCAIENDFESLSENQQIIIGTLGRIRHCLDEMNKKLDVDILCVDEVDRVYEEESMRVDLERLMERMPKIVQFLYFSATLPEKLVPSLSNTTLIRIDEGISETLKSYFFYVCSDAKESALVAMV